MSASRNAYKRESKRLVGSSAPAASYGSSRPNQRPREERRKRSRRHRHEQLVNSTGYQQVKDLPGAPNDRRWYHGRISDAEAKLRLQDTPEPGERGVYLVYDDNDNPDGYVLMLFKDATIHRWRITRRGSDGKYVLGGDNPQSRGHSSVRKLIEYHRGFTGKPIPLDHGGRVVLGDYAYVGDDGNSTRLSDYCCF